MTRQIIILIVVAVSASAVTKYYFPRIETSVVEKTREVVRTDVQTVTKTVTLPTGQVDTTTTIIDHSTHTETASKIAVRLANPTINLSILVGNDLTKPGIVPIYGISANKEFLGPLTLGVFGLTNGLVGASIGFNF